MEFPEIIYVCSFDGKLAAVAQEQEIVGCPLKKDKLCLAKKSVAGICEARRYRLMEVEK